jgi:uncharacterized membrane protein
VDARLQGSIIFAAAAQKPAKSWDRGQFYILSAAVVIMRILCAPFFHPYPT